MRLFEGDVIITRPLWCNEWNKATTIRYEFDIKSLKKGYEVKIIYRPITNKIKSFIYFFIDLKKTFAKNIKCSYILE